jgi:S1-C subfamily serine protease
LEHLKRLKAPTKLTLFGTEVTPDGAAQLAKAMDATEIDYRHGAFLGIGGGGHPLGFLIETVHADSAAARVGLQRNDVIVKFDGQKVLDFEGLTALIGKHAPGATVRLEILRDSKTTVKEVKLGAWD